MAANTPRSRKAKGAAFTKEIVQSILNAFPDLAEADLRPVPSSVPGNDVWMSDKAAKLLNLDIEAKRQESVKIWEWLKQVEDRVEKKKSSELPIVVFRRSKSKAYVCLDFDRFLQLLKCCTA